MREILFRGKKMTSKEVIERLHKIVPERVEDAIMINIAISALYKTIPKKPIEIHRTCLLCPICGKRIRSGNGSSSKGRDYYCQKCGQKLDRSDKNNEIN